MCIVYVGNVDACVPDHANGCGFTFQWCHRGPPLGFKVWVFTARRRGGRVPRPGKEVDRPRGPLFVPPSVEIVADPPSCVDASCVQPLRAAKLWSRAPVLLLELGGGGGGSIKPRVEHGVLEDK